MSGDPYCYPGTSVLRNTAGVRDPAELDHLERRFAATAGMKLAMRRLDGGYDLEHLQAFHQQLFGGLYPWAGQIRTVNISKGDTLFCPALNIEPYAEDIFGKLKADQALQPGSTPPEFARSAAWYLSEINMLHPFREGNGRTQRAFLGQLASDAGHHIDWVQVTPRQNVETFIAATNGTIGPMRRLLTSITEPATDIEETQQLEARLGPRPTDRGAAKIWDRAAKLTHVPPAEQNQDHEQHIDQLAALLDRARENPTTPRPGNTDRTPDIDLGHDLG